MVPKVPICDPQPPSQRKTATIIAHLQGIPGVEARFIYNVIGHMPYGLDLDGDQKITRISIFDVVDRLQAGHPPIWNRIMKCEPE